MTTPTPEEAIARIVDPEAWAFADRHRDNPVMAAEIKHETAKSLSKARDIIAYRSQQEGGEPVAWLRMNPQGTQSTGVTDVSYYADQWRREGSDVRPLYLRSTSQEEGGWRPTHRHLKRGTTYQIIGEGLLQTAVSRGAWDDLPVTIYAGEDGRFWVRPTAEFSDGRFEALPTPPQPSPKTEGGENA